jgi:hypothetical protein
MTTTAPPPEALATAPTAIVISQFEVLLGDIKDAKEKAAEAVFDYSTKAGNKEARSYVFSQRKLKSRIESARTDAKSYALAYGRKVDEQASELKAQVEALIAPHQNALDAINKDEADRVQRHRKMIHFITDLGRVPFGASAEALAISLESAKNASIDELEEFKEKAAAALLETIRTLEAAHAKAVADEAAAAELLQLREQQRIQQEKDAEAKRIKDAEDAAAEVARKAQEQADAAALLVIEEAEQRAAEAQARADAAEAALAPQQAIDAARDEGEAKKTDRAMHLEEMADAVGEAPEALPAIRPAEQAGLSYTCDPAGDTTPCAGFIYRFRPLVAAIDTSTAESNYEAKRRLRKGLMRAMDCMNKTDVVDALVLGTLHPAVQIDWSRV